MSSRADKILALDQVLYGFLEELDKGRSLNIIGIDEVGRGALSGPLSVAAVSLPLRPRISGLNDSKKLSAKRRTELTAQICKVANAYSIVDIEPFEIDLLGIVKAVRKAMAEALAAVTTQLGSADIVLIDGTPLGLHSHEQAIVKGDGKVAAIAAASIIAKVHRDEIMVALSAEHPLYAWDSNKGYGSAAHISAVKKWGLTPMHRYSFCKGIVQEKLF